MERDPFQAQPFPASSGTSGTVTFLSGFGHPPLHPSGDCREEWLKYCAVGAPAP